MKRLITTECVSYGHPDKIADQISDAILDAFIEKDPNTKAGIETMVKDNIVVIGGEVMSNATIDADKIIRGVYGTLKFSPEHKLEPGQIKIINLVGGQSCQINAAVVKDENNEDTDLGAGDQGFMIGYACGNENTGFMPTGMYVARTLVNYTVGIKNLGPDLKTQVTIEEDTETRGKKIHTILISTMHECPLEDLREFLTNAIKRNNIKLDEKIFKLIDKDTKIVINPAGTWTIGGPVADCGLTGRKIVVDAYGASANVGGGSFSSKDGNSKTDRSGAYLCRYIAKNIVAAGISDECKVEIAYMIGIAEPVSINIELFCKNEIWFEDKLVEKVKEIFPMTPKQISDHFSLRRPIYYNLAKNGHFGFEGDDARPWEKIDKVEQIKEVFKK